MTLGFALAFSGFLAAAGPRTVLFPLLPGDGVSEVQAEGVTAMVRNGAEGLDAGFRLVPARGGDAERAARCGDDVACLLDVARVIRIDQLISGRVDPVEGGFAVHLRVLDPEAGEVMREAQGLLRATAADMAEPLDRLVREAFAPETLVGGVFVRGSPAGAQVFVDEKLAGTLPAKPIVGLSEGRHRVRVEKDGHHPLSRSVVVRYPEISTVELILSPRSGEVASQASSAYLGPGALGGAAAAVLVSGATLGVMSLLYRREVEKRAAVDQLLFPRDIRLFHRGGLSAVGANILYGGGLLLGGGATGWAFWVWKAGQEEPPEMLEVPVRGAPKAEDLVPSLEVD